MLWNGMISDDDGMTRIIGILIGRYLLGASVYGGGWVVVCCCFVVVDPSTNSVDFDAMRAMRCDVM